MILLKFRMYLSWNIHENILTLMPDSAKYVGLLTNSE
jgi:hypothetical protein